MQVARFVHGELPAYGIVDGDELVGFDGDEDDTDVLPVVEGGV